MIQTQTKLKVADNSWAKELMCIGILWGTGKKVASVGDVIICSVKKAIPNGTVKAKSVVKAVVVRARKEWRRPDGSYIRFDDNSAVVINNAEEKKPVGSRIFGPVPRELREKKYMRIISLAPEVL